MKLIVLACCLVIFVFFLTKPSEKDSNENYITKHLPPHAPSLLILETKEVGEACLDFLASVDGEKVVNWISNNGFQETSTSDILADEFRDCYFVDYVRSPTCWVFKKIKEHTTSVAIVDPKHARLIGRIRFPDQSGDPPSASAGLAK